MGLKVQRSDIGRPSGMDKPSGFRHENVDQARGFPACRPNQKESQTISMVFSDSLNADSGAAGRAPWPGTDGC
jgi:hypothetical protein